MGQSVWDAGLCYGAHNFACVRVCVRVCVCVNDRAGRGVQARMPIDPDN